VAAVLPLYLPTFLLPLDRAVYDTLARSMPTRPPGSDVVIVDVDERSLSTVGQWPWRRDVVARLIAQLRDLGASAIAMDIIFAEPDRDNGLGTSEDHAHATRPATPDEVLGTTLRDGRVVLGYAMTFDPIARERHDCVLHPLSLATFQAQEDTGEPPYFRATDAVCSLPMLAQSATRSGFLNAAPDSDGILRRVPVLIELEGQVYPSLALATVAAVTGTRDLALRISNVNASMLIADDRAVPLDGKGNLLLRYRGKKKTFSYVSAADVLNGAVPDGAVRNKIVFVGTTALGTREVVATPLDTLFAGVEVQATIADNLLRQDFISRPVFGTAVEVQAVLILGIAIAALAATRGIVPAVLIAVIGVAAAWSGSLWLLSTKGLFVSPLFPTLGAVSVCAVITTAKFGVERLRADRASRDKTIAQRLMVQTLLSLTQARDAETGDHSRRTQRYAKVLAQELSKNPEFQGYLTSGRIELLSSLAPLHDIGKVGIPDHILNKPGPLTPEELVEMRRHPAIGREVILKAEQQVGVLDDEILAMAKDIVYTHHERWDGTGYPRGLHGTEIPVAGRLMALVDVYDAAVTRTLYRSTLSHDNTLAYIVGAKGTHFDPAIVDAFVRVAAEFKIVSGV
jgi:CHASE2 domain-containing sensor protein